MQYVFLHLQELFLHIIQYNTPSQALQYLFLHLHVQELFLHVIYYNTPSQAMQYLFLHLQEPFLH